MIPDICKQEKKNTILLASLINAPLWISYLWFIWDIHIATNQSKQFLSNSHATCLDFTTFLQYACVQTRNICSLYFY